MSRRVHVVMDDALLVSIDKVKGIGQSRGDFIRRTLEEALGGQGSGDTREDAGSRSVMETRATESPASPRASMGKGSFAARPKA